MARKPSLSPSKLTCYLACPHKYYWTYESPHGQWFLKAHSYFSFGQSLHRALETFHKSHGVGVPVQESLAGALEESWIDSGYSSADEMQAAFGEAKQILESYAEDFVTGTQGVDPGAEVLFIEKSLRKPMGVWDLIGRADRIDLLSVEGVRTVDIVDYKSARSGVTSEEVATDIAMSCYALMVRDLFPGDRIRTTIHALKSKEKASHDFSEEELDEFAFSVRELGDTIRNHHWEEFHPRSKRLCTTCEFISLCRKDPDFASDFEPAAQV